MTSWHEQHNRPGPDAEGGAAPRTVADAEAGIRFAVRWQSAEASHQDCYLTPRLDLRRDLLPPGLEAAALDEPAGHRARYRLPPGALVPEYRDQQLLAIDGGRFDRRVVAGRVIEPRGGRFYPTALLRGLAGAAADRAAFRVAPAALGPASGQSLHADLNHPLAGRPLEIGLRIESLDSTGHRQGGGRRKLAGLITANGPGMQARWRGMPTDFFADAPFARNDPRPDDQFYAKPRLVDHLDRTAIAEISALYGRLIPARARILDLMASWHSHLPGELRPQALVGLGMSAAELRANSMLTGHVVQDLNQEPTLPFGDATFDAVVCTVSVEYLVKPFAVFRELARVLRPGGLAAMTFSNRWFPPKAIRIWTELHEFERLGLVLHYFLESGLYGDLNTWSLRGLPRPAGDTYAGRLALSDPVYAVWGRRIDPDAPPAVAPPA